MRATPIAFFLLTAFSSSSAWAQEAEDGGPTEAKIQAPAETEVVQTGPTSTTRGKRVASDESLFSDAEIGDLYQKANAANERSEPKTENFYAVDVEGPIVELAPMVVEGDDARLLARVRREINRRPESVQRRLTEISPLLANRAQDDARNQNSIMVDDFRIGPSDLPSTGGFTAGEISNAVGDAIRAIFVKEK